MRLYEVMAHRVPTPGNHPILTVIEVAEQAWSAFRDFIAARPEITLLGRCPAPVGRLTVFVGCADNGIRLKLEEWLQ